MDIELMGETKPVEYVSYEREKFYLTVKYRDDTTEEDHISSVTRNMDRLLDHDVTGRSDVTLGDVQDAAEALEQEMREQDFIEGEFELYDISVELRKTIRETPYGDTGWDADDDDT